jgi:drug/metabolite transporter (DMT)-like permease
MVIFFTYPALVMVINWLLYKRRPAKAYFAAVAVIMIGLVLLADYNALAVNAVGIVLGVISAAAYAAYIVFSKKIALPPAMSTLMVSAGCSMTCLVLALLDGSFVLPLTGELWINIVAISVICTVVPIVFLLEALKTISSEKASILSVLEPVFVVLAGIVLLGELVSWMQIFGVVIVLGGALVSLLSNEKPKNIE